MQFLGLLHAAKRLAGCGARLGRSHTLALILVGQKREVCEELALEVILGSSSPEKAKDTHQ